MVCEDFGVTPSDSAKFIPQTKLPEMQKSIKHKNYDDVSKLLSKGASAKRKAPANDQVAITKSIGARNIEDLMNRPDFRHDMDLVNKGKMTLDEMRKKYHF